MNENKVVNISSIFVYVIMSMILIFIIVLINILKYFNVINFFVRDNFVFIFIINALISIVIMLLWEDKFETKYQFIKKIK